MRVPIALLLGGLGITAPLRAAAEAPRPLRLADVLEDARQRNPEIQATRQRARAATAVPRQVSAYDDPTFSYEAWNTPNSLRVDEADNNILRLSQKVPFPGKRTLAGTIAERDADMARKEAESVELDVLTAVTRAYYDLWQVHQNLLIYAREKALVERFAHVAEQKYAVGEVSQSDVLRAQVELTRLINRVSTETLAIDSARAELNAWLSRTPDEPLGIPEQPGPPRLDADVSALTRLALERRPELAAQAAAVAREEARVRLARRSYLPDFEFSVARFQNPGARNGFGAIASISIPLAYKSKYDAGAAEASAQLASAEAELRRFQDRVRREVQQAFVRARTTLLKHELFVTTHIPQAEQALRVTESAYQTGTVDFLTLIDSVRAIEAVHLEHIEAAGEFEKARADLERAVGGSEASP
jgi:outer membrane protein TolC